MLIRSTLRRLWPASLSGLLVLTIFALGSTAEAQRRPHLSPGLQKKLNNPKVQSLTVLYSGPAVEANRLAKYYGLTVKKQLHSGAALSGTSEQIRRLANDASVGSLQEDSLVFSTMAVTTQSTGANQVWAGGQPATPFGGITGREVGVALIDSGIAVHGDLKNRVGAILDFTGCSSRKKCGADEFGHGTHLAGIIAGSGGASRTSDSTRVHRHGAGRDDHQREGARG